VVAVGPQGTARRRVGREIGFVNLVHGAPLGDIRQEHRALDHPIEVGAIPDMISQVAENENAIGFETISMIRHLRDKGRVKILKISGNDPANESDLISGKYPLYRVYNITTWEGGGVENPYAANLVKHLLNEMKTVDSEFGMVPAFRLRKSGWLFKNGTGWKFRDNELIGEPH